MNHSLPPRLDCSVLRKAVASLQDALAQPKTQYTRDATIQRFEYTFELSWKTLRRYLAEETGIDGFNIKELFRVAGRQGLIGSVDNWFGYLKARSLTSHTYNERTAEETYQVARAFFPAAAALLVELERRSGAQR